MMSAAADVSQDAALAADIACFLESDASAATRLKIPLWIEVQFRAAFGAALKDEFVAALPFGSCALGVSLVKSDLDITLIVSQAFNVDPATFFQRFPGTLRKAGAEKVVAITAARVPLIKFNVLGIAVDLLFVVAAPNATIKNDKARITELLLNDSLHFVHDTRNSSTGVATAAELLNAVPHKQQFHDLLRCVKVWAQRRGVYSNLYSYIPGVALAVMAARVCQLVPTRSSTELLRAFFEQLMRWLSESHRAQPIMIVKEGGVAPPSYQQLQQSSTGTTTPPPQGTGAAAVPPLLFVADPVLPQTNKAFCVGRSGFEHLYAEARRALRILSATVPSVAAPWRRLWTPYNFARDFDQLLVMRILTAHMPRNSSLHVDAAAGAAEDEEDFLRWVGFTESKLRSLVYSLEATTFKRGRESYRVVVRPLPARLSSRPAGSEFTDEGAASPAATIREAFYVFGVKASHIARSGDRGSATTDTADAALPSVTSDDIAAAVSGFTSSLRSVPPPGRPGQQSVPMRSLEAMRDPQFCLVCYTPAALASGDGERTCDAKRKRDDTDCGEGPPAPMAVES